MASLQLLLAEFATTMSDGVVWLAIGQALALGGVSLLFGTWVARRVGLLQLDAPAGETIGVGLAAGLMVLAAWWAALASGGRSSFTPVAAGFALAIAFALLRPARHTADARALAPEPLEAGGTATTSRWSNLRQPLLVALACAAFIAAVALLYGTTMAPSPRDGVQPLEHPDVAYYAALGADLAVTGTEANYSPSGLDGITELPVQTWYHWGEVWLASAVITLFGTPAVPARYLVVLPVLLLAAAALTGTLVRRIAGTASRRAFVFGFLACLFLAPQPLFPPDPWVPGAFFSSWAVGLTFGITLFGLAAVAALLALYCVVVLGTLRATWALTGFVGSAIAFIVPAHVVIAVLALVGVMSVAMIRFVQSVRATPRLPTVSPVWRHTLALAGIAILAIVAWGAITGHGLAGSVLRPTISPFNAAWRESVSAVARGAGVFVAIPIAWYLVRRNAPAHADIYLGTMALLLAGAIGWGARLGDFNMHHLFFAGIAVFATPVAAAAVWVLLRRLWERRHTYLMLGIAVLCVLQLEWGAVTVAVRLYQFGPLHFKPIALSVLDAIRQLPPDARLAYACEPFAEPGFGQPSLVSIHAHTGRWVVPMCFQADPFAVMIGGQRSVETMSQGFVPYPQRTLYPDAAASPTPAAIKAFLKDHGINYIFADATHPNSLVADAVVIAASGGSRILRIP